MTNSNFPPIRVQGNRFVDPFGREVILHGANLVNKNPDEGYFGSDDRKVFALMRAWGFNCVRLGVIWDGLEPEPGRISQEYLQKLDLRITWAGENQLYVLLDMHQDLFSALFSDGAPAWATLTGGAPHIVVGGIWSDAYFTSPAVQSALDHFWDNAPAPDGIGLQEHYALCWQELARRCAGHPHVIGYDLINEPFPGSSAVDSQMMLFAGGAEALREIDPEHPVSAEELAMQWLDPGGRNRILSLLEDPILYAKIIDVTRPIYNEFEQVKLMPFYQRVADAIRSVDPQRILFLETSMGSNMGVVSGLELLRGAAQSLEPAQAYSPHGYDLVVDTPYLASSSQARVELIFQRHGETQHRLRLPMLVGEWGAFDGSIPRTLPAAWVVSQQFERLLCGDTYWHFSPDLDRLPPFQAISRPYPERVTGKLLEYHCAPDGSEFECIWDEQVDGDSVFYIPDWFNLQERTVVQKPAVTQTKFTQAENGTWLSILSRKEKTLRKLSIR